MTIQQALDVRERTVSFRDAEVLLAAVLKVERSWLHAHTEATLSPEQTKQYASFLQRREQNEPVAYIIGYKEFYGRPFKVDRRVLIPRPETEGLIDQAVAYLKDRKASGPARILELGTGSGNISVTLALELSKHSIAATILATDVSAEALEIAAENWELLGKNTTVQPRFLEASLFGHPKIEQGTPYDLIIANLPYVSDTWKMHPAAQPDVVFHEPDVALFGGSDGLDLYRQFFATAPQFLAPDGAIIIEYGEDQTPALLPLATQAFPTKKASVFQDYAGLDRVVVLR